MFIDTKDAIDSLASMNIAHSRFPFLAEGVAACLAARQVKGGLVLEFTRAIRAAREQRNSDLADAGGGVFSPGEAGSRLAHPRIWADLDLLYAAYDALHLEHKEWRDLATAEAGLALAHAITGLRVGHWLALPEQEAA